MATDARDYEDDLARIETLVGRVSGQGRWEVIDALDDDRDGVMALAERIGSSDNVDNPAALFISCIRKGEHTRAAGAKVLRLTPREAFRKFFLEYQEWLKDVAELDDNRCIEYALDYAVGSMSAFSPRADGKPVKITAYEKDQTALTLEDEMRATLNRPRPVTTGPERTRMNIEWVMIGLCLHDEPVAAMHRALMEQCAIPGQPSHDEARDARAAMVEEIRARGVKPRQPQGPLGPALQEALELVGKVAWSGDA